jgi:phosphate transport system substrate-binding protein
MRRLVWTLVLAMALVIPSQAVSQEGLRLTGSGATFPFPLYSSWFKSFSGKQKGVTVDYQGKGSGAGIQDLLNRTVDFAASDAAMTDEDMAKVPGGVQLLPMTGGEIVLAYNLPGNPQGLKLPREVYANIFLGHITKWSDPRLKAANPGLALPDQDITVVRRADSSGTTFVFTSHLSAISEEWQKGPGAGTTVSWPGGDGGPAALGSVVLPANLRAWVTDPEAPKAYPIATYTWMMFYKENKDPKKAAALRAMVEYCLTEGQKASSAMGYIPLPETVVAASKKAAAGIQ